MPYDKGRPICGPFQTVQHHLHVVIGLCGVPALQCIVMRHVFVWVFYALEEDPHYQAIFCSPCLAISYCRLPSSKLYRGLKMDFTHIKINRRQRESRPVNKKEMYVKKSHYHVVSKGFFEWTLARCHAVARVKEPDFKSIENSVLNYNSSCKYTLKRLGHFNAELHEK